MYEHELYKSCTRVVHICTRIVHCTKVVHKCTKVVQRIGGVNVQITKEKNAQGLESNTKKLWSTDGQTGQKEKKNTQEIGVDFFKKYLGIKKRSKMHDLAT